MCIHVCVCVCVCRAKMTNFVKSHLITLFLSVTVLQASWSSWPPSSSITVGMLGYRCVPSHLSFYVGGLLGLSLVYRLLLMLIPIESSLQPLPGFWGHEESLCAEHFNIK